MTEAAEQLEARRLRLDLEVPTSCRRTGLRSRDLRLGHAATTRDGGPFPFAVLTEQLFDLEHRDLGSRLLPGRQSRPIGSFRMKAEIPERSSPGRKCFGYKTWKTICFLPPVIRSSTMSKVRKWDGDRTFAGTRGNDGVAPFTVVRGV